MTITELRICLLSNGYVPLPITTPDAPGKNAGKAPRLRAWQTIKVTPDVVRAWERTRWTETNTGLRCGHTLGMDIDVRDGDLVHRLRYLARDTIGQTLLERVGQAPKLLLVFRTDSPFSKIKSHRLLMPDGQPALIECLASGQQFVGFGIHPVTRQPYQWGKYSPLDIPAVELPVISEAQAGAFVAEAESLLRSAGGEREDKYTPATARSPTRAPRLASAWPPPTRQDVCDALKTVPNIVDWHWWVKIGAALFDALADDGEDLFLSWSAQSGKNDPDHTRRKWRSFHTSPMVTTAATLFWKARQNGWRPGWEKDKHSNDPRRKETARDAFRLLRRGITDDALMACLHARNRDRSEPLPDREITDTALWAATETKERDHAAR